MPNDSTLVKKSIDERKKLPLSFFDKKKKDLAEIDAFIKDDLRDKEDIRKAKIFRDTVANRAYSKPEIDARVRLSAMRSKK